MTFDPSEPYGEHRQQEIYAMGTLADRPPEIPVRWTALEAAATEAMDDRAAAYVAGGAGSGETMTENRRAFDEWRVVPRLLRDVSERDLSVNVFGQQWDLPMQIAPIGVQSIVHEDGVLETARAAADLDVPICLSSVSSFPIEEITDQLGETPTWFQLYWSSDRSITESFVRRAENAGCDAIVLTVDVPLLGWRERDLEQGYLPMLDGHGLANYTSDPAFCDGLTEPPSENEDAAVQHFLDTFGDPTITWDAVSDLCSMTDLPVVVKGLLHPDDAETAVDHGVDGIVVSNHGGRQVDGELSALDALPRIVERVAGRSAVFFDSGVRSGADALTALALGADAVGIGRPVVYGLALDGADGVRSVLENIRAELDLTLANTGRTSVADLDRSLLVSR
ncbi:alpha-hydroxy-acid oxidizing protein [Halocatena pleomorpha]|uniref:Alpha-hydroxy-acid oxidizing protein n=1 Tax=Halocatena pleomorpha TaxID=1785090 RepID=A0A3P3R3V2_9EURY|nr:alpha-hydroxy-acid oxidizing protein [Halocatena pleomorpha]RRJ28156.1 alpha-hydroxy-acid oxidizing protein [Halocatena pleomorpha]